MPGRKRRFHVRHGIEDYAMSPLDLNVLNTAATPNIEAVVVAPANAVWFQPSAMHPPAARLEGPSTLVLALIGAGILVAYRGLQQRLAPAPKRIATPQRSRQSAGHRRVA